MINLIQQKKEGKILSKADYAFIVEGYLNGTIPDYQMAAFLMTVYFQGMTFEETLHLTELMMHLGETIDLSEIKGIKVDKHSTGGVGDKTTLVVAPLVAAAGLPVAKMSGRGLGHTGGTLDKLDSIKGLQLAFSKEVFIKKIANHGIAVCGQSGNLVPADKKIYALRDVTATVDNISLISASIMSKKLACGADAIVLDVKVGNGSYQKSVEEAEILAKMLMDLGKGMNRKVTAVISAMHQPLGYAVGNALEVKEAIATLKGNGSADLTELCLELGSQMLILGELVSNRTEGVELLKKTIASGKAFEKFKEFVKAQDGDLSVIESTELLPESAHSFFYKSEKTGYINQLNAKNIGITSMLLGAGRATKEDKIDYGAGIVLKKKIGDFVKKGETLAILYSNKQHAFEKVKALMDASYVFGKEPSEKMPLIVKVCT